MTAASSALNSSTVFAGPIMACRACVAMPILRLIGVKVVEWLLPASWIWSGVAVTRIVAVIDMAVETSRTVKPGAGPDEYPSSEPIRPIIAIG